MPVLLLRPRAETFLEIIKLTREKSDICTEKMKTPEMKLKHKLKM